MSNRAPQNQRGLADLTLENIARGALRSLLGMSLALTCLSGLASAGPLTGSIDSHVFVAGRGSAEIVAIDTTRDSISARFTMPGIPNQTVLVEDARRILAIRQDPPAVMILDLDDGSSRAIDLAFTPENMQVSPDGAWLAVAGGTSGSLALVKTDSGQVAHEVKADWAPGYMVFGRKGQVLFLGDRRNPIVHVLDVPSARRLKTLPLSVGARGQGAKGGIRHLARTPGGDLALALDGNGGATMIDLDKQKIAGGTRLRGRNSRSFPTGNNQDFMVHNDSDRTISMISTWTNAESGRLHGFSDVGGINLGLLGSLAFVLNRRDRKVTVVNLDYRKKVRDIHLSSAPETAATDDKGLKLYVALSRENRVAVIDVGSLRVKTVIDGVGSQPWAVFGSAGLSYCH